MPNDPLKSVENIVQLPSARRTHPVPTLQSPRAQPPAPVLFESWVAARDRAAAALLGGTKRLLLIGPAGTGKTVLIEHVARVLRAAGRPVVIQLADADPAPPETGVTLFVDEADRLSSPKLQQLFTDAAGSVVVIGLDPLARRVAAGTMQITLDPLGQRAAQDYIAQWLTLSGRAAAELDSRAVRALVELSGGVPRLLSTLLSAASWLAKSSGASTIEAFHIHQAAELRSVLGPPLPPDASGTATIPALRSRVVWSALLTGVVLAGTAAAIVPRLFPAEFERAVARATPFAERVERWLRAEPSTHPTRVMLTPASPAPIETAPLPLAPVPAVAPPPAAPTAVEQQPAIPAPVEPPNPVAEPRAGEPALEPMPAGPEPAQSVTVPEIKPSEVQPPEASAPPPPVAMSIPVPPPSPAASAIVAPSPVLPIETIELLLRRGREMLAIDDLSAARLLFLRAAEGGSPEAMFELGQTYDPAVRNNAGSPGQSDRVEAVHWYRQAAEHGNRAAEKMLPKP